MRGACLCGAVTVEVRGDHAAQAADLSACHCDPCRRWAGAVLWGFEAARGDVDVTGEVASYASSEFAERVWCPACGTQLWFADLDGPYELNPGLFEETRDWPLARVVYADRAAAHAEIAGDHARRTKAEYEATERHAP
ncbi:GFA family protein [Jannaschia sp. Os4]|uniref:GFA family protein n=1 Tax=Jannaschia sp. Os4 TaxID=2807617 RepID=UPI00193A58D4|nr:GFA family protein [Jannaschia sp. Os4]MBM2575631.1 GFA family protein [Jannaschia sp. Os4]